MVICQRFKGDPIYSIALTSLPGEFGRFMRSSDSRPNMRIYWAFRGNFIQAGSDLYASRVCRRALTPMDSPPGSPTRHPDCSSMCCCPIRAGRARRRHLNDSESFWGFAKTRLARKRGLRREKFHEHLKETEWRWNQRRENLYSLLLKETCRGPLN